ncbi:MAG: phasin family protein [Bosea sp. (in: a-proteobacteria)]
MKEPFKGAAFEVPQEMRDMAEKSVEQAKRAFDGFMGATQEAASRAQSTTEAAQRTAVDGAMKVVGFAEQNVKAAFDHAQKLSQARGLDEVMKLQAEFMQSQMGAMQSQMKAMGESVASAVKPKGK